MRAALATSAPRAASARPQTRGACAAYWALKGLGWLVTWLPERLLGTAAVCIGDLAFFVIRWRRRVACARVALAYPQLSQAQQHTLVRQSYAHLALALLWALRLPRVVDADGVDAVQRLVEINEETRAQLGQLIQGNDGLGGGPTSSSSAIVTTGHVGVWELLPALLGSSLLPRHTQWIVYRPLHNAAVNTLVEELRSGPDRQLIADKNCFRTLEEALTQRSGRPSLVGLVADQRCNSSHTACAVRFLGQETRFATGAARLHLATRSPLWFAALVVNTDAGVRRGQPFKLLLHPISCSADSDQNDVQRLTQAYATALEDVVLAHAAQYLWIHDLWSKRARELIVG